VGEGAGFAVNFARVRHTSKVLDVHLMHDSRSGRNNLEVVERSLAPAQELVALAVALIFEFDVTLEGVLGTEQVCNDRVINHELCRSERIDLRRVPPEFSNGLTHRGEVNDAGNAGEVLHNN